MPVTVLDGISCCWETVKCLFFLVVRGLERVVAFRHAFINPHQDEIEFFLHIIHTLLSLGDIASTRALMCCVYTPGGTGNA